MTTRRPTRAARLISICLLSATALLTATPGAWGGAIVADSTEDAAQIRTTIDDILERPAYTGVGQSPLSRLLRDNPLSRWLLEVWERFLEWLRNLGGNRDPAVPTTQQDPERSSAGLLVALLAVLLVATIALRLARTRDERAERARLQRREGEVTIAELELWADDAERRGAFDEAIRLRFQAGLRRLDDSGAVELDAATPTGRVRSMLALREFDAVANSFEVAAYSDQPVSESDATEAVRGWQDVFRVLDPRAGDDGEDE